MARSHRRPSERQNAQADRAASPGERRMMTNIWGEAREWQNRWQGFLARHGTWWNSQAQREPVYGLPEPVVDELAGTVTSVSTEHRSRRAALTPEEASAEHGFRECCLGYSPSAVGVWDNPPSS